MSRLSSVGYTASDHTSSCAGSSAPVLSGVTCLNGAFDFDRYFSPSPDSVLRILQA
jgi:hypothetical protein